MKRRAFLLAVGTGACGAAPERPFSAAALSVARFAAPVGSAAEAFYWRELEHLRVLAQRRVSSAGASLAAELRTLVFHECGFVREVEDPDVRFTLLPSVLRERRGSCVGLGSLYLALSESLGVTARGVLRPGHFYVRLEHGRTHTNAELLRRGEVMPDDWYLTRFPAPDGTEREYGRPLTLDETLGVIEFNIGNQRRREKRLEAARAAYARSARHFPDFAEAHASLGAVLQLLARKDEARASYEVARRLNPRLPSLEQNLRLLDTEPPL